MKRFFKKTWKIFTTVGVVAGVILGTRQHTPTPPVIVTPPVVEQPTHPTAGEAGQITVHDRQFWQGDQPWTWAGMTAFLDAARIGDGQNIAPQLTQAVDVGAKIRRVFGMVDAFGKSRPEPFAHFYPQEHSNYYDQIIPDTLTQAHAFGERVEFVIFADAGAVMPDAGEQDAHAERVFQVIAQWAEAHQFTTFIEVANEPMVGGNLPGGEERAYRIGKRLQGRSPYVLIASGAYDIGAFEGQAEYPYVLDYFTDHTDRGNEWARKQIDLREHRDGFTWANGVAFKGVRVPTVSDEPRGLDETVWGSRTTDVVAAGQAGGVASMMGSGVTCHSQAGLLSELLGPIQEAGCKAMLTAARFIDPRVQMLNYARGGDQGPCSWAYGSGPVEHTEGPGRRSFAKWIGDQFFVVQAGSDRPAVAPCPGFTLVSEPVQGVALLRQQ